MKFPRVQPERLPEVASDSRSIPSEGGSPEVVTALSKPIVSVHHEEQEIHHKVTKDTKARALFFLVTFVSLGGFVFRLPFLRRRDPAERLQPIAESQLSNLYSIPLTIVLPRAFFEHLGTTTSLL